MFSNTMILQYIQVNKKYDSSCFRLFVISIISVKQTSKSACLLLTIIQFFFLFKTNLCFNNSWYDTRKEFRSLINLILLFIFHKTVLFKQGGAFFRGGKIVVGKKLGAPLPHSAVWDPSLWKANFNLQLLQTLTKILWARANIFWSLLIKMHKEKH